MKCNFVGFRKVHYPEALFLGITKFFSRELHQCVAERVKHDAISKLKYFVNFIKRRRNFFNSMRQKPHIKNQPVGMSQKSFCSSTAIT